ncbi:MAG: hypothetical protein ACRDF0_04890 [Candidatus Limnocylindria bacterium]
MPRAEGRLPPFQRGFGYLALKSGAPIVPVWLRRTTEPYLGCELVARRPADPARPQGRDEAGDSRPRRAGRRLAQIL